jgi:hypothetical protein
MHTSSEEHRPQTRRTTHPGESPPVRGTPASTHGRRPDDRDTTDQPRSRRGHDRSPDEAARLDRRAQARRQEEDQEDDQEARQEAARKKKTKKVAKTTAKKAAADERARTEPPKPTSPEPRPEMFINYTPARTAGSPSSRTANSRSSTPSRPQNVSRVGNIYRGKVVNVERHIQAAFVDFGTEEAGFLHLSDLHPKYFPGAEDDETEKRRQEDAPPQRPPIQQCLKRAGDHRPGPQGGRGHQGPHPHQLPLHPGRFLVMMPDMDRVGVSRKVEDDDPASKMRKILDQLDLPDGFGFILRTAGFERTKTEFKRDLAYLQRLWKDMERGGARAGAAPRLLYSESDLLVRTIRDQLSTGSTRGDRQRARPRPRAAAFMKIVSPTNSPHQALVLRRADARSSTRSASRSRSR